MKFAGVVAYIQGSNGGWFSVYGGLSSGRAAKGLFSLTPSLLCFRMSILLEGPRDSSGGRRLPRKAHSWSSIPGTPHKGGRRESTPQSCPLTSTHTHTTACSAPPLIIFKNLIMKKKSRLTSAMHSTSSMTTSYLKFFQICFCKNK